MGLFDSKTQTSPNMPGYLKGFQKDVLKDAFKRYKSGYNSSYTKPSFAGFSDQSKLAFDGLSTLAGNNSGANGMAPHLQSIMSSGGLNPGQKDAMASMKDLTNNGLMNELINSKDGFTGDQSKAYTALQDTVYGNNATFQDTFNRGGFDDRQAAAYGGLNDTVNRNNFQLDQVMGQGGLTEDQRGAMDRYTTQATTPFEFNEDFLKVRQSALDKQADALSARAASAGRYGGGMDQAILAREQGDLTSRMNVDQMLNDQNQKNLANSALMAGGQQAVGNQIGVNSAQQQGYQNLGTFGQIGQGNQLALNSAQQQGLGNIVDTGGKGVAQNSNAIGQKAGLEAQLFNMNQAGLGNMGQAYETAQQPFMTQRAVGQEYENEKQKLIDDERRIQAEQDPFARMQQYLALINGTPTGQTSTTSPSWAQLLAGGGLGVLGLGSALGGWGAPSTSVGPGATA